MNDKTIKINHSYITTLTSEQTRMAESCYATKSTITLDWWPHFCYTIYQKTRHTDRVINAE